MEKNELKELMTKVMTKYKNEPGNIDEIIENNPYDKDLQKLGKEINRMLKENDRVNALNIMAETATPSEIRNALKSLTEKEKEQITKQNEEYLENLIYEKELA